MHEIKTAHLYESFTYFENAASNLSSQGKLTTLLARYTFDYHLTEDFKLNTLAQYTNFGADGDSFGTPNRNDVALAAIIKHELTERFNYNVSLRQEFSDDITSPLIYGIDGAYRLSDWYTLKFNASRNFRLPTFNDLYWEPGGNLDLKPEDSYQIDIGQELNLKPITLGVNGYLYVQEI